MRTERGVANFIAMVVIAVPFFIFNYWYWRHDDGKRPAAEEQQRKE